ncbi:MAG: helix-turn-helix domain-containing protein, partial [Lachnospiraceae bacterium]
MTHLKSKRHDKILEIIKLKDIETQEDLAEKVGRAYKYCQDIERGSCGMSIETLLKLTATLNVSLDYLIFGPQDDEGERTPYLLLEQESVLEMLGKCSEQKRKYALEILR